MNKPLERAQKFVVAAVFIGIVLAFISYEIFNKATYSYEPLIMRGWLDSKIPIVSIFVIPYVSFHLLAAVGVHRAGAVCEGEEERAAVRDRLDGAVHHRRRLRLERGVSVGVQLLPKSVRGFGAERRSDRADGDDGGLPRFR